MKSNFCKNQWYSSSVHSESKGSLYIKSANVPYKNYQLLITAFVDPEIYKKLSHMANENFPLYYYVWSNFKISHTVIRNNPPIFTQKLRLLEKTSGQLL